MAKGSQARETPGLGGALPRLETFLSEAGSEGLNTWCVYLLCCADGSFYTGVTNDLLRRLRQHNGELAGGARYTQGRRPVRLVWQEASVDRGAAQVREAQIRKLPRSQKISLAASVIGKLEAT